MMKVFNVKKDNRFTQLINESGDVEKDTIKLFSKTNNFVKGKISDKDWEEAENSPLSDYLEDFYLKASKVVNKNSQKDIDKTDEEISEMIHDALKLNRYDL